MTSVVRFAAPRLVRLFWSCLKHSELLFEAIDDERPFAGNPLLPESRRSDCALWLALVHFSPSELGKNSGSGNGGGSDIEESCRPEQSRQHRRIPAELRRSNSALLQREEW